MNLDIHYAIYPSIVFFFICTFLNVLTIALFLKKNKQGKLNAKSFDQKVEIRLTIYAFITFILQLINIIYMVRKKIFYLVKKKLKDI